MDTIASCLERLIEANTHDQHVAEQRLLGNQALMHKWQAAACNVLLESCGHLELSCGALYGVMARLRDITYPNGKLREGMAQDLCIYVTVASKLCPQETT